jgi:hypothetical protein
LTCPGRRPIKRQILEKEGRLRVYRATRSGGARGLIKRPWTHLKAVPERGIKRGGAPFEGTP